MIKLKRRVDILKAYDNIWDAENAINDCLFMNRGAVFNTKARTIQLQCTMLHFKVFNKDEDVMQIAGSEFAQIDVHGKFSQYVTELLQSRQRWPYSLEVED